MNSGMKILLGVAAGTILLGITTPSPGRTEGQLAGVVAMHSA